VLLALVAVVLLAVAVNRVAAGAENSPTEHPPIVVTPAADSDDDDKNEKNEKDDPDDDEPDRVGQDPRSIDDDDDDDLDRD
jgi:hypothetical protein